MLSKLADEFNLFLQQSQLILWPWLLCLAVLWLVNIGNWLIGSRLNVLGLYPRHISGLPGIIFAPILHQNFNHLFFNSIPLFALGLIILARDVGEFFFVTATVVLLEGIAVWFFGRRANHIGASGLVSGYFGFLLATAYFSPSFMSVVVGVLVLYYFGAILWGIFPREERISWETHLFGFLSGILSAFLVRADWVKELLKSLF